MLSTLREANSIRDGFWTRELDDDEDEDVEEEDEEDEDDELK